MLAIGDCLLDKLSILFGPENRKLKLPIATPISDVETLKYTAPHIVGQII
jgi:hypothetical protein